MSGENPPFFRADHQKAAFSPSSCFFSSGQGRARAVSSFMKIRFCLPTRNSLVTHHAPQRMTPGGIPSPQVQGVSSEFSLPLLIPLFLIEIWPFLCVKQNFPPEKEGDPPPDVSALLPPTFVNCFLLCFPALAFFADASFTPGKLAAGFAPLLIWPDSSFFFSSMGEAVLSLLHMKQSFNDLQRGRSVVPLGRCRSLFFFPLAPGTSFLPFLLFQLIVSSLHSPVTASFSSLPHVMTNGTTPRFVIDDGLHMNAPFPPVPLLGDDIISPAPSRNKPFYRPDVGGILKGVASHFSVVPPPSSFTPEAEPV